MIDRGVILPDVRLYPRVKGGVDTSSSPIYRAQYIEPNRSRCIEVKETDDTFLRPIILRRFDF